MKTLKSKSVNKEKNTGRVFEHKSIKDNKKEGSSFKKMKFDSRMLKNQRNCMRFYKNPGKANCKWIKI